MLQSLASFFEFDIEAAFEDLPEKVRKILLFGSGKEIIPFSYINERGRTTVREHAFEGIIPNLELRYQETDSAAVREERRNIRITRRARRAKARRCGPKRATSSSARAKTPRHYEVSGRPLRETLGYFHTLHLEGAKGEIAERWSRKSLRG